MPGGDRTVRCTHFPNFFFFFAAMLTRPAGAKRRIIIVGSIIEGGHRGPVVCCISCQHPNSHHAGEQHHSLGQYAGHPIAFFESADSSKRSDDRFLLEASGRKWRQQYGQQQHNERGRRVEDIAAALARASGASKSQLPGRRTRAPGRIREYGTTWDATKGWPFSEDSATSSGGDCPCTCTCAACTSPHRH